MNYSDKECVNFVILSSTLTNLSPTPSPRSLCSIMQSVNTFGKALFWPHIHNIHKEYPYILYNVKRTGTCGLFTLILA